MPPLPYRPRFWYLLVGVLLASVDGVEGGRGANTLYVSLCCSLLWSVTLALPSSRGSCSGAPLTFASACTSCSFVPRWGRSPLSLSSSLLRGSIPVRDVRLVNKVHMFLTR